MNPEGATKEWYSMLGSLSDPLTKFEPSKGELERRKKLKEESAKAEKAAVEAVLEKEEKLAELRHDLAEAKAKEVAPPLILAMFRWLITFGSQEERRLRAEAREAERIKEEADRKKLEQERAEARY
jgi:hypothetical protein